MNLKLKVTVHLGSRLLPLEVGCVSLLGLSVALVLLWVCGVTLALSFYS